MVERVLLSIHLVAGIVWVGSVYMGTFIDWPAAKESVGKGEFPFRFIVGQGRRVFYSVYFGILMLWGSGVALYFVHPPQTNGQMVMTAIKAACLFFMTAFTVYGTFVTWPKLQLATHEEAYVHYRFYMYRAFGTFMFGIIAALMTLWSF